MNFHDAINITSRQNPFCRKVRSLHSRKGRREHGLFLAEGDNAVSAALSAGWPLRALLGTRQSLQECAVGVERVAAAGGAVYEFDGEMLAWLSEAETSPGIIALAALPEAETDEAIGAGLTLVIDGVADAGNVGTLIRSADAAGAGRVVVTANAADPFSPKVVRSSAGSLFNLPPLLPETPTEFIVKLRAEDIPLVVAVAHEGEDCFQYQWPRHCALVLGHETRGISVELDMAAQARVTIPVYGKAESLNVAAAGAVLLYAWRRAQSQGG